MIVLAYLKHYGKVRRRKKSLIKFRGFLALRKENWEIAQEQKKRRKIVKKSQLMPFFFFCLFQTNGFLGLHLHKRKKAVRGESNSL